MAVAAGHEPLMHYRRMNFMGFSEVRCAISARWRPTRVLPRMPSKWPLPTPDTHRLPVVQSQSRDICRKTRHTRVLLHISQDMGMEKWRIRDIRRYVRRVFSILPFEPAFYRANGGNAEYVGNPSVAEIARQLASAPSREEFLERHKLRDRPMIALMPGSRRGEIRNNLPIMREASDRFPGIVPS